MSEPRIAQTIAAAVDQVLDTLPGDIVLGIPLGIGKPNPFVNALYRRIKDNPKRRLRILTALSLERPVGKSELEQRFLEPLVERVFGNYPDLDYVKDLRGGHLPPNIEVMEFFLKSGDYLGNTLAQQSHISTNYTFVARDLVDLGVNLLAQAVSSRTVDGQLRLSLSSNPDTVFEAIEKLRADPDRQLLTVGVINQSMPFMPNGAEVGPDFFDLLVTDPEATHDLFAPPNAAVSLADYAIGLHASSLVVDGGTLQIGIGSLGDAIAQALIVRDRHADEYRRILQTLTGGDLEGRELGRFDEGLYGCSEMFVNGFLRLIEAGIVRREVYSDPVLQHLVNVGKVKQSVGEGSLRALLEAGRIRSPIGAEDLAFLTRYGVFRPEVRLDGEALVLGERRYVNDLFAEEHFAAIAADLLGPRLTGGIIMHGGFFLGPRDFYEHLRTMPAQQLAKIDMTRIDFINQLYGHGPIVREQRRRARFMNTTMMVTLLGAAVSDAFDTGQVVSGVGGQYNFVAMGHALPDARSILMLRATHEHKDGPHSSIVWNYGHTTIPRHLRDIVVTEYGVADLRGQPDGEVVKRLIAISDSRFQDSLIKQAKTHGKLAADYVLPDRYRHNTPQALADTLKPWHDAGALPDFPFGTDLTDDELKMVRALKKLKHGTNHPMELLDAAVRAVVEKREAPPEYLHRLGLDDMHSFKQMLMRKLFAGNL
jgi:acyl-CoA hydrolase